jgi:N-acetylneuraminic acid mutarotase/glucose/arabinose dehydrogenase
MNIKRLHIISVLTFIIFGIGFGIISDGSAHGEESFEEVRINTGGGTYIDSLGNSWLADTLYNTGNQFTTGDQINGTVDDPLYQSERWDPGSAPELQYAITVPSGEYEVFLHFADIYWGTHAVGARVFDVSIENALFLEDFDIYSEVGGYNALVKSTTTIVTDGVLSIEFTHSIENPKISGIEVHQLEVFEFLEATPVSLLFSDTLIGESSAPVSLTLENLGLTDISISDIFVTGTNASDYSINSTSPYILTPTSTIQIDGTFSPSVAGIRNAELEIVSDDPGSPLHIPLSGIGFNATSTTSTPPVDIHINAGGDVYTDSQGETWNADTLYNTGNAFIGGSPINGTVDDTLYQSERWDPSSAPELQYEIPVPNGDYEVVLHFADIYSGTHAVGTRVFDVSIEGSLFLDNLDIYSEVGANTATTKSATTTVSDEALTIDFSHGVENPKISAIEIHSIEGGGGPPGHFAHAVPGAPQTVVDADFSGAVDVTLDGSYSHTHAFGETITGWTWKIGTSTIATSEFAVVSLPVGFNTITLEVIDSSSNSASDFTTVTVLNGSVPDITTLTPNQGDFSGGTSVTINGSGFTAPVQDTTVHFGPVNLNGGGFNIVDPNTIEVLSPGGTGTVQVTIETPGGISIPKNFTYVDSSLPPIQFASGTVSTSIVGPTSIAFGPDKKLYVGTQFADLHVLTLDDNYNVTNSFVTSLIQTSEPTFRSILGIAFDPFDTDPLNPKVYISHSNLFHGEILNFYNGKVSTLSGPNLSIMEDIITGLPVSDHDHGVNGLEFDNDGKLYIQIGGNTNAGVPGAVSSTGQQKEGVLSAATLVADITEPNFDGAIIYDASANQIGGDVAVFASGERNPYDIVLHSNGKMYGTDNGPNNGFGEKSTGCFSQGPDPSEGDELNLLIQDGYYGHANRARGASDLRQCIWRSIFEASDAEYTAPITTFPASTNGLIEYRADTFGGQLRGHLLASRYRGEQFNVELSPDGLSVLNNTTLFDVGGLDVVVGPDATIFNARVLDGEVIFHKPIEASASDILIRSTFPFRGPLTGGNSLTISGELFTAFGSPSVTVGGEICNVTASTNTSIECTLPAGVTQGAVDVIVLAGGHADTMNDGYTYIGTLPPPALPWTTITSAPIALGELSGATDGTYLYILAGHTQNQDNDQLYRYEPATEIWTTLAPQNVVPLGNHVMTEYINGKIYLFGGVLTGSTDSNALGIYDIASNTWSVGAPLTVLSSVYGIGSAATSVINGKMYVAGGIHNGNQSGNNDKTFVYDPTSNSWAELAPMPSGRNHAAAGTVNGKMYIFGGRQGPNQSSPNFSESFIYDPVTDTWTTGTSMITPRSGTGKAAVLNDELYVIGGEVGGPFSGAWDTVEVYNPTTNTWRTSDSMPTARHGIYPLVHGTDIHVIAGGPQEGFGVSNIHEVFDTTIAGPPPTLPTEARINVGGSLFVDSATNIWSQDMYYNTGNIYAVTDAISGTVEDALYQTERWDPLDATELTYDIPLENGVYDVTLHFADIYYGTHSVGARVFNISIEGATLESNVDIYNEVGSYSALTKSFVINVNDELLTISLLHQIENPKLSAIEVIKQ